MTVELECTEWCFLVNIDWLNTFYNSFSVLQLGTQTLPNPYPGCLNQYSACGNV